MSNSTASFPQPETPSSRSTEEAGLSVPTEPVSSTPDTKSFTASTDLPDSTDAEVIRASAELPSGSASSGAEEYEAPPEGAGWDRPTKRTVLVIMLVGLVLVLWISRSILPLLIGAGIIAYLLSPIVDLGERIRIPRAVTTIVLFALLAVGVVLIPVIFVPILIDQLLELRNFSITDTIAFGTEIYASIYEALDNLPPVVELPLMGIEVPLEGIIEEVTSSVQQTSFVPTLAQFLIYIQQVLNATTTTLGSTAIFGVTIVGGIFQVLIALIIVFFLSLYLTKDAPQIRRYIASLFPASYQSEVAELFRRMGRIWNAFFRGQIILAVFVGVITWGVLTLLGMPGALILAIVAGALEVVPTLGPVIAAIPAVIVALIQGSSTLPADQIDNFGFALITLGAYFLIQQIESSVIVPRVIGSSVNLHPIVVLCGVIVGFEVGGVLGAFLAAPLVATARVLGGYIHAKLLDRVPFAEPVPTPRQSRVYKRRVTGDELAALGESSGEPAGEPRSEAIGESTEPRPVPSIKQVRA